MLCVCQDLDDAELDYLGIVEPRQRARILAMAELLFDSEGEQEEEEEEDPKKPADEEEEDGEGGFDRTCLREAVLQEMTKNICCRPGHATTLPRQHMFSG